MDELLDDLQICAINYAALQPDQDTINKISQWPAAFDASMHTTLADFDVADRLLEEAKRQVSAFLALRSPVHFALLGRSQSTKEFNSIRAMAYTGLQFYNYLITTINRYASKHWPANLLATMFKGNPQFQVPWDLMRLSDDEAQFYLLFCSDQAQELAQYIAMNEQNPISDVAGTVELLLFKTRLASTKCSLLLGDTGAYERACLALEKTIYTWKHHASGFDDHYNLLASVAAPLSEFANNLNSFKSCFSTWQAYTGTLINKIPTARALGDGAVKPTAAAFFSYTAIMLCVMIIILAFLAVKKIIKLRE